MIRLTLASLAAGGIAILIGVVMYARGYDAGVRNTYKATRYTDEFFMPRFNCAKEARGWVCVRTATSTDQQ